MQALQNRTSADKTAWVQELGEYYRKDGRLVYRGMCDRGQASIEELLHIFVSVGTDLLSQGITHKREGALSTVDPIDWTQNNFDLRRSILADLSRYNRDAYNFTLYREANAHQLGPVPGNETAYANSYGFSTSWSYTAAVDFSGVYPGDPPCDTSLVYALYPANHYLDYSDLQSVDYRYSQAYPAERELLGIGAVDPDAVMMVSRLSKGKAQPAITEVLIRDPMNPSNVLYFEGPVDGLEHNLRAGWALLLEDETRLSAAFKKHRVTPPTPPTIPPDSTLEVTPGKPIKVSTNGRERKADKTYTLDFDAPLFPPLPHGDEF